MVPREVVGSEGIYLIVEFSVEYWRSGSFGFTARRAGTPEVVRSVTGMVGL